MPRKVILLKFGSSVLQSRADLPRAVHEIYRWIRRQYQVVAVVSAFAGETDRLLGITDDYRDGNPEAIARIVATGEEIATALLTLELDRFGIPAQVLDPGQIQLIAETGSNDTEPVSVNVHAINNVLDQARVAVIPGFVARDRCGRVALFGRGGSDLSALFLAKQLNARCRLVKDVDGIYDSDPARNIAAMRFDELSFGDALNVGGKIVQRKAIVFGTKTSARFEVAGLGENHATVVGSQRSVLSPRHAGAASLRLGLLGLGTVGLGVFHELWKHPQLFEVTGIAVRRPELHVDDAPKNLLTRNCWDVIEDVDVVVELIGGSDPAGELVHAALAAGKPVVTANKLLLANNAHLEAYGELRYSAAVGGALPALEAVRALADDGSIVSLSGVLNGTCNYILDRIAAGSSWEQAVVEAQAHGFAEADPSADTSGADTVCKLRLLARRAFPDAGAHLITSRGIDAVDADWVRSAARDGYRVRLVGTATVTDGRVHLDVQPKLVDASHPFAQIRNEENCLVINTSQSDPQVWTGRGAGRWPTTVAVMADLWDLSREHRASRHELRPASSEVHKYTARLVQLTTDNWPLTTDFGGAA
jgi:homoserine dehydrogenase